jgi:hypothetical protein
MTEFEEQLAKLENALLLEMTPNELEVYANVEAYGNEADARNEEEFEQMEELERLREELTLINCRPGTSLPCTRFTRLLSSGGEYSSELPDGCSCLRKSGPFCSGLTNGIAR